jgi:hypothetical protein
MKELKPFFMDGRPKGPENPVLFNCGPLRHANWINSIRRNTWWTYVSRQGTALSPSRVTERGSTVFASMSNIVFALSGQKVVQRMSKS